MNHFSIRTGFFLLSHEKDGQSANSGTHNITMRLLNFIELLLCCELTTALMLKPGTGLSRIKRVESFAVKTSGEDKLVPDALVKRGGWWFPNRETPTVTTEETSEDKALDPRDVFIKLQFDTADGMAFAGRAVDTLEDMAMHFRR
jgi:hypothetical protein